MNEDHDEIALDDITIDDVVSAETVDSITDGIDLPDDEPQEEEVIEEEPQEEEEVNEDQDEVEDSPEEDQEEEEEEDEDPEQDGEPTVVSEILEKLGYEPSDEYDDTPEGLLQMTKDISSQMADDRIDEVLNNFPLVKQHLEYVLQGGESNKFMAAHDPRADYGEFELNENDTASQKVILSNYLELKGHDKEFTNELLEDYEDSGKLFKKAAAAKDALSKYQSQQRESMFEAQREETVKKEEQQQDFWNGVANTIKESQEFAGITIPEREKSKFFNYISTPVNNEGTTQRDLDHTEADMEVKLAIDYLMYKGFNLSDIVNKKANTKSVKSLRDKISNRDESLKSARKAQRRKGKFDVDSLDLDI
tara:strand:- start:22025 stop:23116 length:1092 start_codon:yes stop_codon:yes gene_type:complete